MASTVTTVVARTPIEFRSIDNLIQYRFTLTPASGIANNNDTGVCTLVVPQRGRIVGLRVACGSPDFNVSVRTALAVTPPSTKEIYLVQHVVTAMGIYTLAILYANEDTTPVDHLYVMVTNKHATVTGPIELDLFISTL